MMKKLLYIFMCLAMTQACIKENFPTSPNDVTEGEEITLSMSVSVPGMEVATRALGEYDQYGNSHPTLWVVVFDQQGYFVQAAKATDQEFATAEGYPYKTEFQVSLTTSPEQRILHFLLNYSGAETLDLPSSGHESTVIGTLTADSDNQDVYWQRVVLPYGIVPPMKDNKKNTDYTNYVEPYVTNVPLIRNFAKITVTVDEKVDNFTLSGFYVLNRPKTGTVAPYSKGVFVDYQPDLEEDQSLYDALTGAGYIGNEPDGLEFSNTAAPAAGDFSTEATYLYENTAGDENAATTILIAGKFDSDGDKAFDDETVTYYKADLVTNDLVSGGQTYAHILRNFHYELNITSVIASGKDIAGAMNAAANNNLSGSVEIKDLTNVTNGTAGIYVSFTDTTLVSTNPIVLKYKFVPDIKKPTETANGRVTVVAPAGKVLAKKAETGSDITSGGWSGWRTLTITPNALPDHTQEQTIVLYDEATKLRREVLLHLRPKLIMDVECVPESVASVPGTPVVVNIKIPQGLNEALFPLEFAIEANTKAANNSSLKQYISPAKSENTSVRLGETIVTEENTDKTLKYAGQKSYQYIKTLSYDEYLNLTKEGINVVLPVYFITNTATSASTVYVRNTYFADDSDHFNNFSASYKFSNLNFGSRVLPGANNPVTFTFNMDSAAQTLSTVNVTLSGLKPAAGSGLSKVDGTTNQYTYTPTAQAVSLNLQTTQESGDVSVILAADSYVGAVATAPQDLYSFSDLAFSGNVPATEGEGVTFTFNMDTAAPNVPVTVTLVGLQPATGSALTQVEGTSNQYSFTPSATATNPAVTLNLVTTQDSGTVSVSLAAGQYNNASLSAEQANTIELPANTITFNWANSFNLYNQTIDVPTTNNIVIYSDSNYSNVITTLSNVSRGSKNSQTINLGTLKTTDTVYFRFTFTYWYNTQTANFNASARVSDLINRNYTVTLTRQN